MKLRRRWNCPTVHFLFCIPWWSLAAGVCRQTINSSIKNLEEKGIISLEKGKRREQHLYLTPKGQALVQEKIVPVVEMENRIFAAMEPEESRELLRLTKKLVSLYRKEVDAQNFYPGKEENG